MRKQVKSLFEPEVDPEVGSTFARPPPEVVLEVLHRLRNELIKRLEKELEEVKHR